MIQLIRTMSRSLFGSILLNVVSFGFILVAWFALNNLMRFVHYRCQDFSSYQAMMTAFDDGATYLDGGVKNGIPCQNYSYK